MIIPLIVLSFALAMIYCERKAPGQAWPRVGGWWWRAVTMNGIQAALVLITGLAWGKWMLRHRSPLGDEWTDAGGAVVGYLVLTFVYYWWHRWRHQTPFLWRWLHQIHHSAQRLEILTSFYKHPLESLINCFITSAILYLVLGLDPLAASGAVLISGLAELFYHWNHRTPHWIGYILQRPESHCIHHQEGVHHFNYSDLPLWDMLFGTFSNPRKWSGQCGLGADNEGRLGKMLVGVDVTSVSWGTREQ